MNDLTELLARVIEDTKGMPGDKWDWYWRVVDGEADCGMLYEKGLGRAYSVCRAPRYATQDEWNATASGIASLRNLVPRLPELLEAVRRAEATREAMEDYLTTGMGVLRTALNAAPSEEYPSITVDVVKPFLPPPPSEKAG